MRENLLILRRNKGECYTKSCVTWALIWRELLKNGHREWRWSGLKNEWALEETVKGNFKGKRSHSASCLFVFKIFSVHIQPSFACRRELHNFLFWDSSVQLTALTSDGRWVRVVQVPSRLLSPMWIPHHHADRPSGKISGDHGLSLPHLMLWEAEYTNLTPLSWENKWCILLIF